MATPPPTMHTARNDLTLQLIIIGLTLFSATIALPFLPPSLMPNIFWPVVFAARMLAPAFVHWRWLVPLSFWFDLVWGFPLGSQLFPLVAIMAACAMFELQWRNMPQLSWWVMFALLMLPVTLLEASYIALADRVWYDLVSLAGRWLTTICIYPIWHVLLLAIIRQRRHGRVMTN